MATPITREFVEALPGFEWTILGAFSKKLADGPDNSEMFLTIGATPWNHHGVMIYIGSFGTMTNATSQEDVLTLIRLFEGCRIDHPYSEDFDLDEDSEDLDEA